MKLIVRSLVVALAVTGAIATTAANGSSMKTSAIATKASAHPVPCCPPDGSTDCGMGNW